MLEPWEGRKALDTHFLYLVSKHVRKHVLSPPASQRGKWEGHTDWETVQELLLSCSLVSCAVWDAGNDTGRHTPEAGSLLLLAVVLSSVVAVFRGKGNEERACPGVFHVVLWKLKGYWREAPGWDRQPEPHGGSWGTSSSSASKPSHTNNRSVTANPTTNQCQMSTSHLFSSPPPSPAPDAQWMAVKRASAAPKPHLVQLACSPLQTGRCLASSWRQVTISWLW